MAAQHPAKACVQAADFIRNIPLLCPAGIILLEEVLSLLHLTCTEYTCSPSVPLPESKYGVLDSAKTIVDVKTSKSSQDFIVISADGAIWAARAFHYATGARR
jgi:hypothetical protein